MLYLAKHIISVLKTRGGAARQKMKSLVTTTKGGKRTTLVQNDVVERQTIPVT
jgi:hypothetical protein